jgi:hypothetical protein
VFEVRVQGVKVSKTTRLSTYSTTAADIPKAYYIVRRVPLYLVLFAATESLSKKRKTLGEETGADDQDQTAVTTLDTMSALEARIKEEFEAWIGVHGAEKGLILLSVTISSQL